MERTGASRGVVGVKEKYEDVIVLPPPAAAGGVSPSTRSRTPIPAGDEFLLVFDVIGRVVPPGGLPKDVGAIVQNVETLVNLGEGATRHAQVPHRGRSRRASPDAAGSRWHHLP